MEILPGIHWVRGVIGCNCWLVIESDRALVIDTGLPGNGRLIVRYAESHGVLDRLKFIVLTHADIDHGGSADELRKITGAKIAVHAAEAAFIAERSNLPGLFYWASRLWPRLNRSARFTPDVLLQDGDRIGGFKVVHTPGHTPGSVCLWQPGKLIFVGDALRTHANDRLLTPSRPTARDMALAMNSLRKIAALDFDALFGGHGPPVVGNASAKLRKMLARLSNHS
jgi:glyoxylase-like metal-dependent hydrolase (beta-lactamase superfamily II)